MKQSFLCLFLICFTAVFSQQKAVDEDYVNDKILRYDDYVYKPNIKTIKIHLSSWEDAMPIIDLNGGEQIELSFDDLDSDKKQYSATFVHCNSDWTPSDLMISEYLNGYFDLNFYNNFDFSVNTLQKYTHYSILFPQQNLQFIKSGNYIVYVYNTIDKKDIVLSRRFMVYENKVAITPTVRQGIGSDGQQNKQHIDFSIYTSNYELTNPFTDLKIVITQNNRWDNAVTNIKPTFMSGNSMTYSLDDASTFNGGNEFRYFDIRNIRIPVDKVKEVYRNDEEMRYHATLNNEDDRSKKSYLFYNDINGRFLIKSYNALGNANNDLDADYVYVDFFLPYQTPESGGNFYILGKLTDWRLNKSSKMIYNEKRMGYEAKLYLKQGYYNYMIVLSNDQNQKGDETFLEGDHFDTENEYAIYVYHRKIGTYYDALIGTKKFGSFKR
ncbi:MAG: DUF5103 domain-containing protein [Bacteroidetes bacterium]|nr:DUF5103 domain-containing protein [Bacteroidota bacterium]